MTDTKPDWRAIGARRVARHFLIEPAATVASAAAAICGAHAQVLSAGELSLGLRTAGATRADVQAALWDDHTLIKTFGPRGTVHLLPADELPMWIGALSAIALLPVSLPEDLRMSPEQIEVVLDAAGAALADAELTVDELTEAIAERAGSWAADLVMPAFQGMWPRWRLALHLAGHRGVLCFGPNRGRNVTYTNPARLVPGLTAMPGDEAIRALVHRFLHAYGPATPAQFAKWLSVPVPWAAPLFDELEPVGDLGYVNPGDTEWPEPVASLRLLPYFDAYSVGCHPRERVFAGAAFERALNRGQAGNYPVLLIDGTVAGVWHQRRSGRRIAITVEPLGTLSKKQLRALDDEVALIGTVMDGKPELTIGTVAVGPHA